MAKSKSKYAHIYPTLPPFAPDAKKQEKIDATVPLVTKEMEVVTANALTQEFVNLRRKKDWLKSVLSDIEIRLEAANMLLIKYYEIEGVTQVQLTDNAGCRLQPEIYTKVIDREKFRQWCIANGYEKDLRLWPATTQAITRELLLAGEPAPDGLEPTRKTKPTRIKGGLEVIDDSWLDEYTDSEEFKEIEE